MFNTDVGLEDIPVEPLRELYEYWNRIRGTRMMPARIDIQPAELASILPLLVLVDVEQNPERFKIRLMGTETVKVMGEDLTGQYLETLHDHEKLTQHMLWLVESHKPYLSCDTMSWKNKNYLSYYALALPLSDNDRDVNMILFGFHYFFNTGVGEARTQAE
ncbi:PAS domain-containing protein [Emcibacter sp.]|uniref:PAS domain-containing protein n=1 Tax=Emcibacter sp. TaxID=1979954 RepID=UPI003A944230